MNRILVFFLTFFLFLTSCTDNGSAIFYQIENERPIADNNLPNELFPMSLISDGNSLYLAGGRMYTRAFDEREWSRITAPGGSTRYLISRLVWLESSETLVAFGTEFIDSNETGFFLSADQGASWGSHATMVSDGETVSFVVEDLIYSQNRSFIITKSDNEVFEIVNVSGNTLELQKMDAFSEIEKPILSITEYQGELVAVTEDELLSTTAIPSPVETTTESRYNAIHYSTLFNHLYLGYSNGKIHALINDEWIEQESGITRRINSFSDITVYDSEGNSIEALVAATTRGYYEKISAEETFTSPETTTDRNYGNHELSRSAISRILSFELGGSFYTYALTAGNNGLWINSNLAWNRE